MLEATTDREDVSSRSWFTGNPSAGSPSGRRVIRVLLVEDDEVDARLVGLYAAGIDAFRIEIVRALSTSEASSLVETQGFDACILDFWLGCESSLRFLGGLRDAGNAMPALVLTSLSTPDVRGLCEDVGATFFLGKGSLTTASLEAAMRTILNLTDDCAGPSTQQAARSPNGRLLDVLFDPSALPLPSDAAMSTIAPAIRADLARVEAATEPVRFGIFEKHFGQAGALAARETCDTAATLYNAIEVARTMTSARGQTIVVTGTEGLMATTFDKASLLFMLFELVDRASHQSASDTRIGASVACWDGRLQVSFTSDAPPVHNAGSVGFGALFTRLLRDHDGWVTNVLDDNGRLVLTAYCMVPLEDPMPRPSTRHS